MLNPTAAARRRSLSLPCGRPPHPSPLPAAQVSKEEAAELFKDNPFKQAIITSKLPDGAMTTVYRSGKFVDLCRGPHLPNTSRVKAFAVTKTSGSQWLGKQGNDELQRVYGITFPDKKELAEWKTLQEEAVRRARGTATRSAPGGRAIGREPPSPPPWDVARRTHRALWRRCITPPPRVRRMARPGLSACRADPRP